LNRAYQSLKFVLKMFSSQVKGHWGYPPLITVPDNMIHMLCALMIHIVMDIFEITISIANYLLYVIIIMLIYGIKMIWKMPIILTIQKLNFRYFSVRGFADVLKSDPFDGKNFLIWKTKMKLWLTAMSCFHAAEGKPANLPAEDEAKFKAEV
jgi:hypothetical protein